VYYNFFYNLFYFILTYFIKFYFSLNEIQDKHKNIYTYNIDIWHHNEENSMCWVLLDLLKYGRINFFLRERNFINSVITQTAIFTANINAHVIL